MLRTLFQWFDTHPDSYWAIAAIPTLLWLYYSIAPAARPDRQRDSPRHELLFLFSVLAALVAWRWPYWLNANPFNPDESQFIAGALTLNRDPLFWRSVDGTTSGPLNFYPLLPLHWLGLPLDYFSARVTGILLVWGAIIGCYRLLRSWYGVVAARLGVLPLTAFFVAVTDADFLHYSSEHVPLALTALSAAGLLGFVPPRERPWTFLLGGLMAGMLPWAKLQTAPIAATLICFGLGRILVDTVSSRPTRIRFAVKLVVAAALPSAVILLVVGAGGQIGHLYHDYLVQNLSYIDQNWSMKSALRQLVKFSFESGNLPAFAGVALVVIVLAAAIGKAATKKLFLAAGLLTGVAVFCVIAPKRPSLHYTLLTLVPLGIWSGMAISELWQWRDRTSSWRFLATGAAVAAVIAILGIRLTQGVPDMFGQFSDHWRRPRSATGNIVRALTNSKDCLAVWGWMDRVYVDSRLSQATHESETFEQIAPSRQQSHYRERYVADLEKSLPAVFVDATGPGAPYFNDRGTAAHETVPALAEFVRLHYRLLTDLGYARIYVQPERIAARPISPTQLWKMITDGRRDDDIRPPSSIAPKQLARKKIGSRMVTMMLPPAEMVWNLDGSEREVFFEYGFDPIAYEKGKSNGAVVIGELQIAGSASRLLFSRTLDPASRDADRGLQVSRIVLPPFPARAKFVLRTTPGEFDDNAWDWVYVGKVDWIHVPFYSPNQFPDFALVPDRVETEYASLLDEGSETVLMTHAPAAMQFSLTGRERRWQFDFGFQPGAYTGNGHTDGATFIVELKHADQPMVILFSRHLNPVSVAGDRGRQHGDVAIPVIQPGDQMIMRIDPGGSNAWDWTYLTHLQTEQRSP